MSDTSAFRVPRGQTAASLSCKTNAYKIAIGMGVVVIGGIGFLAYRHIQKMKLDKIAVPVGHVTNAVGTSGHVVQCDVDGTCKLVDKSSRQVVKVVPVATGVGKRIPAQCENQNQDDIRDIDTFGYAPGTVGKATGANISEVWSQGSVVMGGVSAAQRANVTGPSRASVSDFETEDGVIIVRSDDQFRRLIDEPRKQAVIVFGQTWCGYCTKLRPTFAKAAQQCGDKIPFVYVDCANVSKAMQERFNVKGYPTVVKTSGAGYVPCNDRDVDGLVRFARA